MTKSTSKAGGDSRIGALVLVVIVIAAMVAWLLHSRSAVSVAYDASGRDSRDGEAGRYLHAELIGDGKRPLDGTRTASADKRNDRPPLERATEESSRDLLRAGKLKAYTLVDINADEVVPGLALSARKRGVETTYTSDDKGELLLDSRLSPAALRDRSLRWKVQVRAPDEDNADVIYVARARRIRLTLEFEEDATTSLPRRGQPVRCFLGFLAGPQMDEWREGRHGEVQLRALFERVAWPSVKEVDLRTRTLRLEEFVVPRIDVGRLMVHIAGWMPHSASLLGEPETESGVTELTLRMVSAPRLTGVIEGWEDFKPGVRQMMVTVAYEGDPTSFPYAEARAAGVAFSTSVEKVSRRMRGWLQVKLVVDKHGRFSVPLVSRGGVASIRIASAGYKFVDVQIRPDGTPARVRPAESVGATFGIRASGRLLREMDVEISDITDAAQTTFKLRSNSSGEFPADWLRSGRQYSLTIGDRSIDNSRRRLVIWQGQDELVLDALETW